MRGVEENANLIYSDLLSKQALGNIDKVSMSDIVKQLIEKGYRIETVITSISAITGINLNNNSISMSTNGTETIRVIYEGNSQGIEYYAVIKGLYYKMVLSNSGVQIDKTAKTIEDNGSGVNLAATVTSGTTVTVEEIQGNYIILKAGSETGLSTVTVTYGDYSKECVVSVINAPLEDEATSTVQINSEYGSIDVIWLSETTNTYSPTPNAPDLYTNLEEGKRLTPVTWTYYENGITVDEKTVNWTEDTTAKSTWYNYTTVNGNGDNTTSMWANAKNADGSYFVWVPRFAYRIIYYSDDSHTNVTGYYDGYGMWNAEDRKKKYDLEEGIETVSYNGNKYIVHPAFMKDTAKKDSSGNMLEDYDRGGWDKNLTGIWVAKYEMSRTGANSESSGSGYNTTFLSVPNVQSARSIAVGNMYQASLSYDALKESHMMKNSEWGAVVYLTQSQYGRNGHEIDINNCANYITGIGGGSNSATQVSEILNEYNTVLGAKASSTGNVYGIYDLSGGSWEYVAGYNRLGNVSRLEGKSNGLNMTKDAKDSEGKYISTKYITAYNNATTDNRSTSVLIGLGKVGDATKEVRKAEESLNWFSDNSVFVSIGAPFWGRGGACTEEIYAGIFYSDSTNGGAFNLVSFRVALGK